jgi:hypothetical protein
LHATRELARLLPPGVSQLDEVEGLFRLGRRVLVTAALEAEGDVVERGKSAYDWNTVLTFRW